MPGRVVWGLMAVLLTVVPSLAAQPAPKNTDGVAARILTARLSEAGSAGALRELGVFLLFGIGGPADPLTGQAYIEMAREGGDEAATVFNRYGKVLSVEDRRKAEEIKIDWKRKHGDPR